MDDSDLERPFFQPVLSGWVTAHDGLKWICDHDWSEFTQLRIHMGLSEPVPSPEITRGYLGTMLGLFPLLLDRDSATGRSFATVMAFTDPGVGYWTIRVEDGRVTRLDGAGGLQSCATGLRWPRRSCSTLPESARGAACWIMPLAMGDSGRAGQAFQQAQGVAEATGARLIHWQILAARAELAARQGDGDGAQDFREKARRIVKEIAGLPGH